MIKVDDDLNRGRDLRSVVDLAEEVVEERVVVVREDLNICNEKGASALLSAMPIVESGERWQMDSSEWTLGGRREEGRSRTSLMVKSEITSTKAHLSNCK